VEKIETAVAPGFQQHFVEAMAIPHATAVFEQLARRVDLSGISSGEPTGHGRHRRRTGRRNRRRRVGRI
jgi:uncharacterized 2Fe-2S/4Fe-4S cluster protein (DUF4445 family)